MSVHSIAPSPASTMLMFTTSATSVSFDVPLPASSLSFRLQPLSVSLTPWTHRHLRPPPLRQPSGLHSLLPHPSRVPPTRPCQPLPPYRRPLRHLRPPPPRRPSGLHSSLTHPSRVHPTRPCQPLPPYRRPLCHLRPPPPRQPLSLHSPLTHLPRVHSSRPCQPLPPHHCPCLLLSPT